MRCALQIFIVFSVIGCSAGYRPNRDSSSLASSKLSAPERAFLLDLADSMRGQSEICQVAAEKAQNRQIAEFAKNFEDDAKPIRQRALKLLADNQLKDTDEPPPKAVQQMTELRSLSGPDLDRTYIAAAIRELLLDISRCETQVRDGADAQVKTFARDTLPVLHKQLDEAQRISASLPAAK